MIELSSLPKEEFIEEVRAISDPNIPLKRLEVEDAGRLSYLLDKIQREGLLEPLLILVKSDGSKILWDGHHRLIVLERLGWRKVPVTYQSEKSFLREGGADYEGL